MKIKLLSILLLSLIITLIGATPLLAATSTTIKYFTSRSGDKCTVLGPEWLDGIDVECGNLIATGCIDSYPSGPGTPDTPCGLEEAFQTIINFTQLILAMTGSVLILMFIYGGTMMIISGAPFSGKGDNRKTVNAGKDAITAAIIGLLIILGAWLAINFTILALTEGKVGSDTAQLFNRNFNKEPISGDPQ